MKPLRSILTAGLALAIFSTGVRAETFPIFEDASGGATVSVASGSAGTLSISSRSTAFINFAVSSGQGNPTFNIDPATVTGARLTIFLARASKTGTLSVQTLTSGFTETLNRPAPAPTISPAAPLGTIPLAAFTPSLNKDYFIIDITAQVRTWLTSPASEFGIAITSDGTATATLASKEGAGSGHPAIIEIDVNKGGGTVAGTTAVFTGAVSGATFSGASFNSSGTVAGTTGSFTGAVATGGLNVSGGSARVTGTGSTARLDLTPFSPGANDPATRIQGTDDGGFGGHLDFFTKPIGAATNTLVNRMRISDNGRVGIGTTTPTQAILVVNGSVANSFGGQNVGYLSQTFSGANTPGGADPLSIFASNEIGAAAFVAFSDARIKTIQGRSDGAADLRTLSSIEITDYLYKDVIGKSRRPQKKVIAQQVEQVFPQAVNRNVGVVPDIYEKASIADGWVTLATDLKVGDRVRLIAAKSEGIHEVLEVEEGRFRTDFQPPGAEVFVFGREVNDFRAVDYEAIAMLNISATQEIARKLKAKDAEIAALTQKVAALEAADKAREARLARLESALDGGAARTVRAAFIAE